MYATGSMLPAAGCRRGTAWRLRFARSRTWMFSTLYLPAVGSALDCFSSEDHFHLCCCATAEVVELRECWWGDRSWLACCSHLEEACVRPNQAIPADESQGWLPDTLASWAPLAAEGFPDRVAERVAAQDLPVHEVAELAKDPDLECETPGMERWVALKWKARQAVAERSALPSRDLAQLADALLGDAEEADRQAMLLVYGAVNQDASFPEDLRRWPFPAYCILGHFTALYIIAWAHSANSQALGLAKQSLAVAARILRHDTLDLLPHTTWPFSSWDVLSNLAALREGLPFRLKQDYYSFDVHVPPCFLPVADLSRLSRSRHGGPRRSGSGRIVVWATSKHPGILDDMVSLAALWREHGASDHEIEVHSHVVSEYCDYPWYAESVCTRDARIKSILRDEQVRSFASQAACGRERGQWCGLQDLHADFSSVAAEFAAALGPELDGEVDVYFCGHPLVWCRLFERFRHTPSILGVWDMPHNFAVPLLMQQRSALDGRLFDLVRAGEEQKLAHRAVRLPQLAGAVVAWAARSVLPAVGDSLGVVGPVPAGEQRQRPAQRLPHTLRRGGAFSHRRCGAFRRRACATARVVGSRSALREVVPEVYARHLPRRGPGRLRRRELEAHGVLWHGLGVSRA